MIVTDTSALVAIVLGEDDAERYLTRLQSEKVLVGAATVVESGTVVEAEQGPDAARDLGLLLDGVAATVVPVDADHAQAAVTAWRRFGKGRHPAGLNLGDCFSYATAKLANAPLLFKGEDFAQNRSAERMVTWPIGRTRLARKESPSPASSASRRPASSTPTPAAPSPPGSKWWS